MSNTSLRRPLVTEETTLEETVRHLSLAELTSPPGTAFNYFNPNYNVLALVVAEVIGVKLEDYLVENVFEPLEITHSFTKLEPARQAGFMISTAEDMAHYMIVLINSGTFRQKPLLSPEAIQVMQTPHQVFSVIMLRDGQHKKKSATSSSDIMVKWKLSTQKSSSCQTRNWALPC